MSFTFQSPRSLNLPFTLSACALAVALAGCGGGDGSSSEETLALSTSTSAAPELGQDSTSVAEAGTSQDPATEADRSNFDPELSGLQPAFADAVGADGAEREAVATVASGVNATTPGNITVPYPTIHNLSVQWAIEGDANLNGIVSVRYRQAGTSTWYEAMALRRVPEGSNSVGFSWTNRHSGSILNLKADTAYEIELKLNDPDGGSTTRVVTARTRSVPGISPGSVTRNVTPSNFSSVLASAQPGDVLNLAAGSYSGFTLSRNGTAAKRLVIRSNGGAVINGNIDLSGREFVNLHGLTIKGEVKFNNSKNLSITRNTITTSRDGIHSRLRSENAYIADNTITGSTTWASSSLGVSGNNIGEGIQLTGPGHVVMNNRVKGFRDAISLMEQSEAVDQYSIDIVNNDVSVGADDGIEADYCYHNCRVMNNRVSNSFVGLSSQPSMGGPTYFIRNVMYNVLYSPFKLHNGSVGNVVLHNTVVKNGDAMGVYSTVPFSHTLFRNNLFIGGPSAGSFGGYSTGSGRVLSVTALDTRTFSMNHDALGSTTGSFSARLGGSSYSSLSALQSGTTAKKSIQVGLDAFAAQVAYPSSPMTQYAMPDLRLKSGSAAQSKAIRIPNVNDRYTGSAPDMGALEVGFAAPHYGPR